MCRANLWFLMAMTWMGSRSSSAKTLTLLRSTIIEMFAEHLIHINSLLDARTFFFEIFFVTYMYIRSKWRNQFRVRDHHIRTRGLFAGGSPRPRPRSPRWGRPRPAPESPCRSRISPVVTSPLWVRRVLGPNVYLVRNVATIFFDNICTFCCCADKNRRKSGGRSEHTIICELLRVFLRIYSSVKRTIASAGYRERLETETVWAGREILLPFEFHDVGLAQNEFIQHMRVKLNTSTSFVYRF